MADARRGNYFEADFAIRHWTLPLTGGSATGLSVTDAWRRAESMMFQSTAMAPGESN